MPCFSLLLTTHCHTFILLCMLLPPRHQSLSYFHTLDNLTPACYLKVVQEYERAVIFRLGRSWHLNHDDVQYIIKIAISWNQRLKTDLNKVHKVCHHCFFDVTNLVLVSPQDSNGIRLRSGGAKGPGLFFIVPCIDQYRFSIFLESKTHAMLLWIYCHHHHDQLWLISASST